MRGRFVALNATVKGHRAKAKKLLTEDGELYYRLHSTLGALLDAYLNWDDRIAAFYAIELHALIDEILEDN
jgi:hypothetical protein